MATGTKRIMVSLPIEIITDEIFTKLPAESLVRFKCLSKYYNTLISSPEFIDLHLRQSHSSDANRVLIIAGKNGASIHSFDLDTPNSTAIKIPLPHSLDDRLVSIVGSFNGLLCIELAYPLGVNNEYDLVLINPSIGVYREVPHINTPDGPMILGLAEKFRVSFGFGFDDLNNDYKFVRVAENAVEYHPYLGDEVFNREVMVFSLNSNKWKLVEEVDRPTDSLQMNQNGVLLHNHLLHWLFRGSYEYRIYCFDARSDKWVNNVPLMDLYTHRMAELDDEHKDKVDHEQGLEVLFGCLCLATVTNMSGVIWIMKEYGVKESWVKLFDVSPFFDIGSCYYHVHRPYGFRQGRKHEVLVRNEDRSRLFWCDIGSESYGIVEEIKGFPHFEEACFFKGSLVEIPGGEKIIASKDREEIFVEMLDEML